MFFKSYPVVILNKCHQKSWASPLLLAVGAGNLARKRRGFTVEEVGKT